MKRYFFAAMLLLLAVMAAGCNAPAVVSTTAPQVPPAQPVAANPPTAISLEAGKGGLAGQVADAAARWNGETVMVYAAPFTAVNGQEEGFYVLEPDVHPHAELGAGGTFQIGAVEPGAYVLVVGPSARDGKLVMNENGKPKVFTVKAGEILQTGPLTLAE